MLIEKFDCDFSLQFIGKTKKGFRNENSADFVVLRKTEHFSDLECLNSSSKHSLRFIFKEENERMSGFKPPCASCTEPDNDNHACNIYSVH